MDFKVYHNPNPKPKKRRPGLGKWRLLISLIIGLFVVGSILVNILTDYIWMRSLGFGQVFTIIFLTKLLIGVIGFLLFGLALFFTLFWIRRVYLAQFEAPAMPAFILKRRVFFGLAALASVLFGLFGSSLIRGLGWERFLNFFNQTAFGVKDPYFGLDIAFFVFSLPFLNFVGGLLIGLTVFILLMEIAAYSVFRLYRINRSAQIHLGVTLGILGILLAFMHILGPYGTLLTNQVNLFQQSVVYGLSYTDHWVNIPKSYLLAAISLLGTMWIITSLVRGRLGKMIYAPLLYLGVLAVGQAVSLVVQSFVVSPNEFIKEQPYLQHNLDYTRLAYGINDVKETTHPANLTLDDAMLERNQETVKNIRINDNRPLLDVYNQLQTFRTYYEFNDVDIDRYLIDGKYQQVFLGARELDTTHLPSQAQTWMNQTLRYTHGYGVAMSHVNEVTTQGQPEYMIKDLPPKGIIDVTRPQIYFGEEPYNNVIVDSTIDEFDYPAGDENAYHRFEAKSGIPLKGLNRLLFAWSEGSFRMLISGQITGNSQLLETRNILDRLNRIAPMLTFDNDPYIVVRDDGTLVWIVDAYTESGNYPYSEDVDWNTNYIKNPVKAVVDAYTGEVHFYVVDPTEAILSTYAKIFPGLFSAEIPDDIRAHFRYPHKLFKIQADVYRTYHMTNLEVFYNREDFWQFPTENYYQSDTEMEPYYVTMKMPDSEHEEFILMMPFTPNNRQNMIAWMAVRNDGEHYGEMLVYRFPKQKTVYGPQQIENRINQNAQISQQLNLWSQGGSQVIRGNLLVIPIEDTLLYVEPLYIESSNETSLPEVKQIIMAYGDIIVMEKDFQSALDRLLQMIGQGPLPEPGAQQQPGPDQPPILSAQEQLTRVAELFNRYQEAVSRGDWEESGRVMSQIQGILGPLQKPDREQQESGAGIDGQNGGSPGDIGPRSPADSGAPAADDTRR